MAQISQMLKFVPRKKNQKTDDYHILIPTSNGTLHQINKWNYGGSNNKLPIYYLN